MSSLRNAVKRKTHKERAQPLARRRFGLLEKKKDYRQRADDYHRKEKTIQTLRRKADERNPDEFYFAMHNQRTKDGVHIASSTEPNKYTQEELRLMKTQDQGYVTLKAQVDAKKVQRLRESLHFPNGHKTSAHQHTLFVEDEDMEDAQRPLADRHADALVSAPEPEGARGTPDGGAGPPPLLGKLRRRQQAMYRELSQREERQQQLSQLAADMRLQKQLMGKGRLQKIKPKQTEDGAAAAVYKWHKVRQR
ncbi:hypothetical protein WJX73_004489 [Symbiochloris irregularis]|uniref:U3 small nucleolar RNA-associated protein 11 n=1 Tax=Symbiochloris irregularis TaxID=706552 RepID=A0AAW1PRL8_9CHLO